MRSRRLFRLIAALLPGLLSACAAGPESDPAPVRTDLSASSPGSPALGEALARTHCSGCHSVERSGESPMKAAPPLRSIGALYPVADLQEAFAEGVVTAHPAMPAFEFEPDEIADLLAWMDSLNGLNPGSDPSRQARPGN